MFMPPEAVPKEQWGPGPWQDEPDELTWSDADTGHKCLIKRTWHGNLCGYVGLSEGHPLYGKNYSDRIPLDDAPQPGLAASSGAIPLLLEALHNYEHGSDGKAAIDTIFDVHGSLTYTDFWEDQDDGLWYFGFDCGHCDDFQPGLIAVCELASGHTSVLRNYGTYRTIEYVQSQCSRLARQLKNLDIPGGNH